MINELFLKKNPRTLYYKTFRIHYTQQKVDSGNESFFLSADVSQGRGRTQILRANP